MKKQISARLVQINAARVRASVAAAALVGSGLAMADGIDTSAAVTTIGTGAAAIAAMGAAYLALTVLKKLWGKIGGR